MALLTEAARVPRDRNGLLHVHDVQVVGAGEMGRTSELKVPAGHVWAVPDKSRQLAAQKQAVGRHS